MNYHTANKWFHNGTLPVPAIQLPSGTILVELPEQVDTRCVVYARVSSADQRESLGLQVARVVEWATSQGLSVDEVVTEVGSALNGARRKFLKVLSDPSASVIVAEHRDRVCRFGFEYVQAALRAQKRKILVVDDSELPDDLVRDMTEVMTSLCARVYGRRGAAKRAAAALTAAESAADAAV